MEKLFQLEKEKKIWNVFYKNIPVWSYMRGAWYGQFLPYNPNLKVSLRDVKGFLLFISLLFCKNKVVIFVSSRKDLIDYALLVANKKYSEKKVILFTRSESDIKGNVFILELIRFFFRKFSWIFSCFSYLRIIKEIKTKVPDCNGKLLKDLIGDYYFNNFLSLFLDNAYAVLYSNAVVPRVERYMNLYNSIELQHGVVHKGHLDYVNVPHISNYFYCYSDLVKKDLAIWGFSGKVDVVEKERSLIKEKYSIVIFSTVDVSYSKLIEEFCEQNSKVNNKIRVKLHPRDQYPYTQKVLDLCVKAITPLEVGIPILPDTSMISDCFLNDKYFIYLSLNSYSEEDNYSYLVDKYNIYNESEGRRFKVCFNVDDLIVALGEDDGI